jgi:hypothetical protein
MSESAVLDEVTLEAPAAPSTPARPVEDPVPAKRPKRFVANLRFNGLRYLVLATSLGLAWGLLRAATLYGAGRPESTFMLALAGGLLAAAAKTVIDILEWAAVARQATHVERVRAVQRVFQRACVVREQAILDWRRIHTRLVDNLSGESQTIRLFHDHDETDRQAEALFQKALSEEMWVRVEGVDAARRFKKDIAALDYDGLATEPAFTAAFNGLMNGLRRDLALAAIGIPID